MLRSVFNMCIFRPPCFPKKNDTFNFQETWGNDFNQLQKYLNKNKLPYELIPDTCSVKITFNNSSENLSIKDLKSYIKDIPKNNSFSFEIESDEDTTPSTLIITRKHKLISSSLM
jgi:hypothetical protein